MTTATLAPATLDDLEKEERKAELIDGRIVILMPAGGEHNEVAFNIAVSLREYASRRGVGRVYTDGMGFAIRPKLPNGRESFAPGAAYHTGPFPTDRQALGIGGPTFAVEVRSPDQYGPAAEAEMADKRADYFLAGTLAVWDVNLDAETVDLYLSTSATPRVFRRGDVADAGPAVPGWSMSVANVFALP